VNIGKTGQLVTVHVVQPRGAIELLKKFIPKNGHAKGGVVVDVFDHGIKRPFGESPWGHVELFAESGNGPFGSFLHWKQKSLPLSVGRTTSPSNHAWLFRSRL
jgi:hypothetical protein